MVLTDKQLMLDNKSFKQQLKYSACQDKSEGDSGKSQTIRVALRRVFANDGVEVGVVVGVVRALPS